MWTVVGRILPAGRRRAHDKSSISSTIRPSLQPAGGFTNNLFCLFVCVVLYFCVFVYFFICVFVFFVIREFAFCVVYLCICTYLCIRIPISACVSVHLCIYICTTIFVWFVFVSLYLCVLSWWAEDRLSYPFPQFDLPSSQPLVFPIRSDGDKRQTQYLKQCIDLWRFWTLSSLGGFVNLNPSFTQLSRCSRSSHLWWDRGCPELRWEVQNAI